MDSKTISPPEYSESPPQQIGPAPTVVYTQQPSAATATVTPSTVIPGPTVIAPTVITAPQMGTKPQMFVCRSCDKRIITEVRYKSTTKTHLIALCMCVVCLGLCAWIPYCMNSCKNIDHYCPNCQVYIGTYAANQELF